jgi:hypothetical protein
MAISSQVYPAAAAAMFNNDINSGDTYKLMLLTSSYSYSNAHTVVSDVSANEISGTGYSTGGATITVSAAQSDDDSKTEFTLGNVLFSSATFTFRKAVIYNSTSNALLMYLDFGTTQDVSGQNYQLNAPSPLPSITPVAPA